jgi:hypothetical protein
MKLHTWVNTRVINRPLADREIVIHHSEELYKDSVALRRVTKLICDSIALKCASVEPVLFNLSLLLSN